MQLVVLTGFLGSGKTTALLSFARELAATGAKVAIVVNEIGEVGIDNLLLKQLGANVWELLGGCVCCTLGPDLAITLRQIAADYNSDYVFVEPSGASNASSISEMLEYCEDLKKIPIRWLAIVDPLRLEELVTVLEPLMESHIRSAELVVITKKDLATPAEIEAARRWVSSLRPDIPCVAVDMKSESGRASFKELIACLK